MGSFHGQASLLPTCYWLGTHVATPTSWEGRERDSAVFSKESTRIEREMGRSDKQRKCSIHQGSSSLGDSNSLVGLDYLLGAPQFGEFLLFISSF